MLARLSCQTNQNYMTVRLYVNLYSTIGERSITIILMRYCNTYIGSYTLSDAGKDRHDAWCWASQDVYEPRIRHECSFIFIF